VRVKGMHFQLHLEGLGLLQPGHHSSSEPVYAQHWVQIGGKQLVPGIMHYEAVELITPDF
jgi:hypothetical protein